MPAKFGIHYKPKAMSGKTAYFDHLRWKLKQENRNRSQLDAQLASSNNMITNGLGAALDVANQIAAKAASARVQMALQDKMAERSNAAGDASSAVGEVGKTVDKLA